MKHQENLPTFGVWHYSQSEIQYETKVQREQEAWCFSSRSKSLSSLNNSSIMVIHEDETSVANVNAQNDSISICNTRKESLIATDHSSNCKLFFLNKL